MADTLQTPHPRVCSEICMHALAAIWTVLTEVRLAVLVLTTVWSDLLGRAWKPIPVTAVGLIFRPGRVHLLRANTERMRRALAFVWKHHPEPTWWALRDLCAQQHWPPTRPLVVSGALVFDSVPGVESGVPLGLSIQLDLTARTVSLTHSSAARGPPLCVHPESSSVTKMASLADVLAPLLGRHTCPRGKPE